MNRLSREDSFEGRLDRSWQLMSSDGKREFEQKYGDWSQLSDEQRASCLSDYFYYLRQQERTQKAKEEVERIRTIMEPYMRTLEGFAGSLDKRFGQIEGRLEQISTAGEDLGGHVRELEEGLKGQKHVKELSIVGMPTGMHPQVQVNTNYPLKMDCRYREKEGPKECIVVESTPEGRYGTCTVGDQVRRMQILPRLFTTAFEKAGCPSNKLVRPCEYYLTKRISIS